MLVYLHEYRPDDAGNAREGEPLDLDSESYFDVDDLTLDEWEYVSREGRDLQRRSHQFEGVSAVSVPEGSADDDLPGKTVQLRLDGGSEYVEHAEIVEVQDASP